MRKGQKHNETTREKMKLAKLGYIPWNKGLLGFNKGHLVSEETKKKISQGNKGKKLSKEHIEKLITSHQGQKAWNKGKKGVQTHSAETREKIRLAHLGEKNYQWIKDRTLLKDDHKDRGGQLHRDWSRRVKNRDNWKCKIKNKDCNEKLEAHHILSWKDHPELRYELNNGITLCKFHHPRKKEDEKRLTPYFQELLNQVAPVEEQPLTT